MMTFGPNAEWVMDMRTGTAIRIPNEMTAHTQLSSLVRSDVVIRSIMRAVRRQHINPHTLSPTQRRLIAKARLLQYHTGCIRRLATN